MTRVRQGLIRKVAELEAALAAANAGYKLLWDEHERLRKALEMAQRENLKLCEELNRKEAECQKKPT